MDPANDNGAADGKRSPTVGASRGARRPLAIFAIAVAVAGALSLHGQDGLAWPVAVAGGAGAGLFAYLFMGLVHPQAARGALARIAAPEQRLLRAVLTGLLIGGLAAGGMHVHDGAPWDETALGFAGFFAFGFLIAYFPILLWIASLWSIAS